jgi:hypothetical protein
MAERKCKGICDGSQAFSAVYQCMAVTEKLPLDQFSLPYWGKAYSKNLIGAGFVIGFKNAAGDGWRIDFDTDPSPKSKKLHINYEGKDGTKVYHPFSHIDSAILVNSIYMPDGMKRLPAQEQMKRVWYTWTKRFASEGLRDSTVMLSMRQYPATGNDANTFVQKILEASQYNQIAHLLTPPS